VQSNILKLVAGTFLTHGKLSFCSNLRHHNPVTITPFPKRTNAHSVKPILGCGKMHCRVGGEITGKVASTRHRVTFRRPDNEA
jgi:hypothetical protein